MYHSYSNHKIVSAASFSFSREAYSRFKFGDGAIAEAFGKELFAGFIAAHRELVLSHDSIVLLPSPYTHIPTASCHMAFAFRKAMNDFLYTQHRKALLESRIHRYKTYSADYGNMSREERVKLIATDTYHVDRDFLNNRLCIFIDDVKITGGHEYILRQMIAKEKLAGTFVFLYFAELVNPDIPPTIENELNYYYVQSPAQVIALMNSNGFLFNTRVVKYVLHSHKDQLDEYICKVKKEQLERLAGYAIGNNYHLMDEYQSNLDQIIKYINYGN